MDKEKILGIIYKVTNKINGKVYIGQTVQSLDKRKARHIRDALCGENNFFYFHRAIRKYGEENFIWEIIVKCYSKEELNVAEIKTIEKYDTFKNGYNLTKGGGGNVGLKPSKETKKKMSEAQKGEKNFWYGKYGSKNSTSKKYIITTPRGEEIFIHGLLDFCRDYKKEKLNYRHLVNVAQGERKHHKGYKCRYFGEEPPLYDKYDGRHNRAKKYIITTPESEEILVHGIAEFCKNYRKEKLDYSCLIKVTKGKQKCHKGYKCRYFGEESPLYKHSLARKYIVTTPEGKEVFVHGLREFCRNCKEEKLNSGHLIEVAKGKCRRHKGYKCEYFIG